MNFQNIPEFENATQQLIDTYYQWDNADFTELKSKTWEFNGRKIELEMNKSEEFNNLIKDVFSGFLSKDSQLIYNGKKYCYAMITCGSVDMNKPLTNDEARTFAKKIYDTGLQVIVELKNISVLNVRVRDLKHDGIVYPIALIEEYIVKSTSIIHTIENVETRYTPVEVGSMRVRDNKLMYSKYQERLKHPEKSRLGDFFRFND